MELLATSKKSLVNIMMLHELGLSTSHNSIAPLKSGIATLFSYMLMGTLPALPYFIAWGILKKSTPQLIPVIIIGVIGLFSLGAAKASVLNLSPTKSGL